MFGYSNCSEHFMMRTRKFVFDGVYDTARQEDANKNRFEEFVTVDNLMIDHGISKSTKLPFKIVLPEKDITDVHDHGGEESLALFRKCALQIVEYNKQFES